MDQETIRNLQESAALLPLGDAAPVEAFYERLFELAPELRPMFKIDIRLQSAKLSEMLGWVVQHLESPELVPALRALGARHSAYGVEVDHYAPVGSALIWMFRETLGDRFTAEMEEAWIAAFTLISTEMERGQRGALAD